MDTAPTKNPTLSDALISMSQAMTHIADKLEKLQARVDKLEGVITKTFPPLEPMTDEQRMESFRESAKRLFESGDITEEDYASVVRDYETMATNSKL